MREADVCAMAREKSDDAERADADEAAWCQGSKSRGFRYGVPHQKLSVNEISERREQDFAPFNL